MVVTKKKAKRYQVIWGETIITTCHTYLTTLDDHMSSCSSSMSEVDIKSIGASSAICHRVETHDSWNALASGPSMGISNGGASGCDEVVDCCG